MRREEDDGEVLRPIVEPMRALSMSADFARVWSSLVGLVLTCRVDIHATAVLDGRVSLASADVEVVMILLMVVRRRRVAVLVFARKYVVWL